MSEALQAEIERLRAIIAQLESDAQEYCRQIVALEEKLAGRATAQKSRAKR